VITLSGHVRSRKPIGAKLEYLVLGSFNMGCLTYPLRLIAKRGFGSAVMETRRILGCAARRSRS